MSKIEKIVGKNNKSWKKIFFFLLVALFLVAFIFLPNVAFAEWATELFGNDSYANELYELIYVLSHVVYVFIWPCLSIAWAALDNSLIYGSILHLDAALWNIWNIMKNFANFTLWFIFIFTIVRNLFAWSFGNSNYDPITGARKTIVRTLIAWVLVQMSWFLVSVLIDLSTILIYAVWWIPLSMLWSYDHNVAEMPIMKLNMEFDSSNVFYYYSYSWVNYSPCFLVNKGWDAKEKMALPPLNWAYIAWRQYLYMSDRTTFKSWYCVLNGYLYKYEESPWFFCDLPWWNPEGSWCYSRSWDTVSQANVAYLNSLKNYLHNLGTWGVETDVNRCFLLNAYNKDYDPTSCQEICSGFWEIPYTWDIFSGNVNWFTLKKLMDNSKWWVWPFITMYSSILNYQDLVIDPWSEKIAWNLFGLIINTFFAIVLFIPIAILMILLVIRIGYLWVVVAISPILILLEYWLDDNMKKNLTSIIKKFNVKEVMKIIFSPVIVVFAVSMSIIFLSAIFKSQPNKTDESAVLSAFWVEKIGTWGNLWSQSEWWNLEANGNCSFSEEKKVGTETYSVLWLVTVKINTQNYNHWMSMFARVLLEFFATWIVWIFMKFAIWMMWDTLWEKWKKFMESAEKFVESLPIVPLPGWYWSVWIGAIKDWKVWLTAKLNSITNKMNQESDEILQKRFPWAYWISEKDSGSETGSVSSEAVKEVHTYITEHPDVTFANLPSEHKETLAKLYWEEKLTQNSYNTFVAYHKDADVINAGESLSTPSKAKTNADALMFSKNQMDRAVRSDPNWKAWASWMVAWSVQTSDWVFMVDYLGGTSVPWNQQYEIVTREEYEKRHFPAATPEKGMQSITRNDYEKYNDDQKKALDEHFKQIEEELSELERIQEKRKNGKALEWNEELVEKSISKNLNISSDDLKKLKESLWIS